MNTEAMYKLTYGLFVLTARKGDKENGCIINTAIQAASMPNQISICLNKADYTHDMILHTKEFTISVIRKNVGFELIKRFGFQSGRDVDKFEDFNFCKRGNNGIMYITEGTNAFISVKVTKIEDIGSHTMFIGEVTDMEVLDEVPSATYEYYLNSLWQTLKANVQKLECISVWRVDCEFGATQGKYDLALCAKKNDLDAIHEA